MKYSRWLVLLIAVSIPTAVLAEDLHLIENVPFEIDVHAIDDLDNDGDMDILIASSHYWEHDETWHQHIRAYENQDGLFVEHIYRDELYDPGALTILDADFDGDLDVVVSQHGSTIPWYRNDGGFQFSEHEMPQPTQAPYSKYPDDPDEDNDMDFVFHEFYFDIDLNEYVQEVRLAEQTEPGTFVNHVLDTWYGQEYVRFSSYWVDLDGDGLKDILNRRYFWVDPDQTSEYDVYWNNGNLEFTGQNLTTIPHDVIVPIRVDNDASIDLLRVPGQSAVQTFLQTEARTFESQILMEGDFEAHYAADYNLDGRQDLLGVEDGWMYVVYGTNYGYSEPEGLIDVEHQVVGVADLDGDLAPDLLAWIFDWDLQICQIVWIENDLVVHADEFVEPVLPKTPTMTIHPNPFNTSTTATITLPKPTLVELALVDLLGRTVWNHTGQYTIGPNRVTIDGSTVSSGIYLLNVHAGSWQRTQRVVLVK